MPWWRGGGGQRGREGGRNEAFGVGGVGGGGDSCPGDGVGLIVYQPVEDVLILLRRPAPLPRPPPPPTLSLLIITELIFCYEFFQRAGCKT